jgi:hypothetical protein
VIKIRKKKKEINMEKNKVIKSNSGNDINMNKSQDLSKNLNIFKQHYYPKVENNPFIFKETKIKKKKSLNLKSNT